MSDDLVQPKLEFYDAHTGWYEAPCPWLENGQLADYWEDLKLMSERVTKPVRMTIARSGAVWEYHPCGEVR